MSFGDFDIFLHHIITGNKRLVESYFKYKYLERKNEQFFTPLLLAVKSGWVNIVKFLIEKRCNIEACDKSGWRSIHIACDRGLLDIVKMLCKVHCNLNTYNNDGLCPIHCACSNGHLDVVQFLIKERKCIESSDKFGWRPLHHACSRGRMDLVKYLIDNDCDVEACNKFKERPIHLACGTGQLDLTHLLLDKGCDLECSDDFGWRPIHHACCEGSADTLRLLHSYKCDIESCDNDDWRPVHIACKAGHIDIVQYLLNQRCSMEACCHKNGWRPIHIASRYGRMNIVHFLFSHQINMESCDKNGWRSIHHACFKNHIETVMYLCQNHCIIEASDKNGLRPLHLACSNGHIDVAMVLISHRANIEALDKNDWKPIHHACARGHVDLVKLLCDHNCVIDAHDQQNDSSPFGLARINDHRAVIDALNEHLNRHKIKKISKLLNNECNADCKHDFCLTALSSNAVKKYQLIGAGSFGQVNKLVDPETNLGLAIKSVKFDGVCSDVVEKEIKAYPKLDKHDFVTSCFGLKIRLQEIYIIMEYVSGSSLDRQIATSGTLGYRNIIRYCDHILRGLIFLHKNRIIHGNIKPKNILIDDNDNAKLSDYGLMSLLRKISTDNIFDSLNRNSNAYYMAPEVINDKNYDFPADIWSFGATVVEMLTGKPPYSELITNAVLFKIATTKKIIFQPLEPMSKNMIAFVKLTFNSIPSDRASAQHLLSFLLDNDLMKPSV